MTTTATASTLPQGLIDQVLALTPEQRKELAEFVALEDMPTDQRTEVQLSSDLLSDAEAADTGAIPSLTREAAQQQRQQFLRSKYGIEG
jgi:hypothetical protein